MGAEDFRIEEVAVGPLGSRVRLEGRLTYRHAPRLRDELRSLIRIPSATRVDLSGVDQLDGGAAAVLAEAWGNALRGGAAVVFEGAEGKVKSVLDLYTERIARECTRPPPARVGVFEQVGDATVRLLALVREVLNFFGACTVALGQAVRRPATVNWRDVGRLMERHGADGVPITVLIGFLIGLITAFQAGVQLTKFGADSLVADLVGLSVTRELAPLMTAIVVAGRSGAAIAAEMGTMKVSEEIDALDTLGLCPYRFLVFPRVIAVIVVLPVLTILADAVGLIGGLVIALATLDVTLPGYLIATQAALDASDVFGGVLKAVVFGSIISFLACERGLATRGGAEGVGRSTTSAVVAILFQLIVADALFAVLFNLYGI